MFSRPQVLTDWHRQMFRARSSKLYDKLRLFATQTAHKHKRTTHYNSYSTKLVDKIHTESVFQSKFWGTCSRCCSQSERLWWKTGTDLPWVTLPTWINFFPISLTAPTAFSAEMKADWEMKSIQAIGCAADYARQAGLHWCIIIRTNRVDARVWRIQLIERYCVRLLCLGHLSLSPLPPPSSIDSVGSATNV